jgi:PEP-CTERM motif
LDLNKQGGGMNCNFKKRRRLASASLLAIVLGSGDANAVVFQAVGGSEYIIPSTGWYDFAVAGALGVGSDAQGALVGGELFLDAGAILGMVVGGPGENGGGIGNGYAGSGGGGSFVFNEGWLLFAAGGGGGNFFFGPSGGPGIGNGGYPADPASYGGAGGGGPNNGGGGGGGAPGGAAGQGGYSYVIKIARDAFGTTGGNPGYSGYVSINAVVPEPSTWAMMLAGFSALGAMLFRRGRKGITPT